MRPKRVLCGPFIGFTLILILCVLGIIIDFFQGVTLVHHEDDMIGNAFAVLGSYLSYCLYPAVGVCLFYGERISNRVVSNIMLPVSYFAAMAFADGYHGAKIEYILAHYIGCPENYWPIARWLFWAIAFAWVPILFSRQIDDYDRDKLCFTGVTILGTGLVSEAITVWSKIIPVSLMRDFRGIGVINAILNPLIMMSAWVRMFRYTWENYDCSKVWPNGNMTAAALMLSIPLLTDVTKKRSDRKNTIAFLLAFVFVVAYGLNRIRMTDHGLGDICSDTLITYLLLAACGFIAFYDPVKDKVEDKARSKKGSKL